MVKAQILVTAPDAGVFDYGPAALPAGGAVVMVMSAPSNGRVP